MDTINLNKVAPGTKFRTRDHKVATFIGMDKGFMSDDYVVECEGEQYNVYENGAFYPSVENDEDLMEIISEPSISEHDEIVTTSDSNFTETQKRLEIADLAKSLFLMYAKENTTTLSVATRVDNWYKIAEKFINMKYHYIQTGEVI